MLVAYSSASALIFLTVIKRWCHKAYSAIDKFFVIGIFLQRVPVFNLDQLSAESGCGTEDGSDVLSAYFTQACHVGMSTVGRYSFAGSFVL